MNGKQLKAAREAARLTQYELAARIGVRGETICRWERGVSPISKIRAEDIKAALTKEKAFK